MGVGRFLSLLDFVLASGEFGETEGRDFVVGFDLEFARLVGGDVSIGFPGSAAMFYRDVG